jgi:hypothetical protein
LPIAAPATARRTVRSSGSSAVCCRCSTPMVDPTSDRDWSTR